MDEASGNGEGWTRKKLDIEDYIDSIDDRDIPLIVRQLREHAWLQKDRSSKEMVTSMELMDLHRSTLLDGVSADVCLTLKAVKCDLKSLNWQDCLVTSLLTYGADGTSPSSAGDRTVSLKRKRSRRSGRKEVKVAVDDSIVSATDTTIVAGSTTTERSGDCSSAET